MRILFVVVFILGAAAIFFGCANAAEKEKGGDRAAYVRLIPAEAKDMLEKNPQVVLVDVRTPEEYAEKHIPNARLIPNETIKGEVPGLAKDAVILLYCRTGHRSQQAANKLLDAGYQHVYDMEGGITKWPYETEAGAAQ